MKARVRYVHWHAEEAQSRGARLAALGYAVACDPIEGAAWKSFARAPDADVVVMDLERLPAHGRQVALYLQQTSATRRIPLIFLGGAREKVARLRAELPGAAFTTWRGIGAALRRALATPAPDPAPPAPTPSRAASGAAGDSGTPLPKKLGIQADMRVGLHRAPADFAATLGALPDGVRLLRDPRSACDLDLLFCARAADLTRAATLAQRLGRGGLWLCWPKKASGVRTDVSDASVRAAGLATGLVDVKVCAVDATWSGLRFVRRKAR